MAKDNIISAIDIGSSKITCLITSPSIDEEKKVNVVGAATTPSRGIRKGQVVDIEEAVGSITDCVEAAERMAGFNISDALVAVSGEHIESLNSNGVVAVNEPEGEITQDDVFRVIEAARAVSMPSSREILHILPREFIVDSQRGIKDPLGMTGVRLECEAHLITASSTANRNIKKCVNELSIKPHSLVFSGLASSYSTLTETEKELGVILVDIGGGTTSVSVFIEGACSYSAVIPVGAKNITNDLAIGLRIGLDSAEKIKQFLSNEKPEKNDTDKKARDEINLSSLGLKEDIRQASRRTIIEGIIKPRLAEIYSLVGSAIKKGGFAGATPAGIVLTGGGSLTVDAAIICKRTLQLPVRVSYPKGLSGLTDEIDSPAYAAVVGLILYGLSQGKSHTSSFNLDSFVKNIPIKGSGEKIINWIKSFLP
jgi:cell division protein FtsA